MKTIETFHDRHRSVYPVIKRIKTLARERGETVVLIKIPVSSVPPNGLAPLADQFRIDFGISPDQDWHYKSR